MNVGAIGYREPYDEVCYHCGKTFQCFDTWALKRTVKKKERYFCSCSCLMAYDKADVKTDGRSARYNGQYVRSLRVIRQYFGLSREDVADYLGTAPATIRDCENSGAKMSLARVEKLAAGFGCTVEDITSDHFDQSAATAWVCTIPHIGK